MKHTKRLSYLEEATEWNECLPLGNGFLGIMMGGSTDIEELYLNEDSFWYGGFRDRNNKDAWKYLPKIREMIFHEKLDQAKSLALKALAGVPESQRHYLPAGKLRFYFGHKKVSNYHRSLDLSTATAKVTYRYEGVDYTRTCFTSYPANVMVLRIEASKKESLHFELDFGCERYVDRIESKEGDSLLRFSYAGGESAVTLSNLVKVVSDGEVTAIGASVVVEKASKAEIYLSMATTYRYENPAEYCEKQVDLASKKGYESLYQEHLLDYQSLFQRMDLDLCQDTFLDDTKELLKAASTASLKQLAETYFHYGRYLLISSSREGSLPANLQGIWNKDYLPSWDSKYTININTEMNYWPAELLNLSKCHSPLFEQIKKMEPNGRHTATTMYGAKGFCAHHNTDIWGDTAPQDRVDCSTFWPLGAAWLCTHLVEHYRYTLDLGFAKDYYYLLKGACEFILDFQVLHNGQYITSPSTSPENLYIAPNGQVSAFSYACTMDTQIIHYLFQGTIEIIEVLGEDSGFADSLRERLKNMPSPVPIAADGRIMEWIQDYPEYEKGHRHISHLYGLYPANLFGNHPTNLIAAKRTLEDRLSCGGGHTGWSMAWIINMWARLQEREAVEDCLLKLFQNSTYSNLLDKHPPFQIDGNFGAIAGIGECLVQSHNDYIELLPCLPKPWTQGAVSGICVRGGYELSFSWKEGEIEHLEWKSRAGAKKCPIIKYRGKILDPVPRE